MLQTKHAMENWNDEGKRPHMQLMQPISEIWASVLQAIRHCKTAIVDCLNQSGPGEALPYGTKETLAC